MKIIYSIYDDLDCYQYVNQNKYCKHIFVRKHFNIDYFTIYIIIYNDLNYLCNYFVCIYRP